MKAEDAGDKVLITGGTGSTGSALAIRLREAGVPLRTASRNARQEMAGEHIYFDWQDETTHAPALEGVNRVYLVAPGLVSDAEEIMTSFLGRALAAGVRRAVLLSSSAIPEGGPVLGKVHQVVRGMMPEWAVLQPSWFMQNFSTGTHGKTIAADGEIVTATGDGKVGFVDIRDIAEVAFFALTNAEAPNRAYTITGPEALSYAEAAAIISQAAQRPVRHQSVRSEQLRHNMMEAGIPEEYAALLADLDDAIQKGAENRVTSTVQDVTGRSPKSFQDFARENALLWRQT